MRLYIIRHGDPDYEHDDLTPRGHGEAEALAAFFSSRPELAPHEIFASPLGRAQRTASYTAQALGLPIATEPWIAEISALRDERIGHMVWDYDPAILASLSPQTQANTLSSGNWRNLVPFDHIELSPALATLYAGSDDFLVRQGFNREGDSSLYKTDGSNSKRVAVFCHNGSGLAWLSRLLRLPLPLVWGTLFFPTTSVTTVLFEERTRGLAAARCIGMGEVAHLRVAGLEANTQGLKANTL